MKTLRDFATEQMDAFTCELGAPPDRQEAIERWVRHLVSCGGIPDEILEAMPEISRYNYPQDSPQEYECGCVAVTRVTDRDTRHKEMPFEMRLALPCDGTRCTRSHDSQADT